MLRQQQFFLCTNESKPWIEKSKLCIQNAIIHSWPHLLEWLAEVPPTESSLYPGVCPDDSEGQYRERYSWLPYKGHCYLFITEVMEWADAVSSCVRHGKWQTTLDTLDTCCPCHYITSHYYYSVLKGGTLASIEDPDEQKFIASTVEIFKDSHPSFWVGLYKTHKGMKSFLGNFLGIKTLTVSFFHLY